MLLGLDIAVVGCVRFVLACWVAGAGSQGVDKVKRYQVCTRRLFPYFQPRVDLPRGSSYQFKPSLGSTNHIHRIGLVG